MNSLVFLPHKFWSCSGPLLIFARRLAADVLPLDDTPIYI